MLFRSVSIFAFCLLLLNFSSNTLFAAQSLPNENHQTPKEKTDSFRKKELHCEQQLSQSHAFNSNEEEQIKIKRNDLITSSDIISTREIVPEIYEISKPTPQPISSENKPTPKTPLKTNNNISTWDKFKSLFVRTKLRIGTIDEIIEQLHSLPKSIRLKVLKTNLHYFSSLHLIDEALPIAEKISATESEQLEALKILSPKSFINFKKQPYAIIDYEILRLSEENKYLLLKNLINEHEFKLSKKTFFQLLKNAPHRIEKLINNLNQETINEFLDFDLNKEITMADQYSLDMKQIQIIEKMISDPIKRFNIIMQIHDYYLNEPSIDMPNIISNMMTPDLKDRINYNNEKSNILSMKPSIHRDYLIKKFITMHIEKIDVDAFSDLIELVLDTETYEDTYKEYLKKSEILNGDIKKLLHFINLNRFKDQIDDFLYVIASSPRAATLSDEEIDLIIHACNDIETKISIRSKIAHARAMSKQ